MRKILALVFLLALPAVSWGASAESITIHVNRINPNDGA